MNSGTVTPFIFFLFTCYLDLYIPIKTPGKPN